MAQFYRKAGDKTVYKDEAFTQGISTEAEANSLGVIPDWGSTAANTNINTITPDSLKSEAAMKTLTPNDGMDYYNQIFNNAIAGFGDTQKTVDANTEKTKGTVDEVSKLSDMLLGKAADTQTANETAGVNSERDNNTSLTNELNDTTAQINALARQAQAIPMQTQQDAEKRFMTDAGAAPLTASALRENAIKALTLGQKSDILNASLTNSSNRLADAKDKAKQIVDLKYKPIEDEIKNLKDQLEMNKTYITDPAEKKLAEQQTAILNERTRKLEEDKATETQISGIAVDAAKNGASVDVIKAISESKDYVSAIRAAGDSLATPNTQVITLEDGNTVLIDTKTGNVVKNFGGAKAVTPSVSEQLAASAAGYNIGSDGKITTSATVSIPATTLAGKNNNPGNLRFVGQAGASKGQGGFASFSTPEAGYQALLNQISLDASRGLTVQQFVNKYAPPSENDTSQYIQQFTTALGCSAGTALSSLDLGKVGEFMAKKESGTVITGAKSTTTGDNPYSSSAGGKILPATQASLLAEGSQMGSLISNLQKTLDDNISVFGPIYGRASSSNPWDVQAQTINSSVMTAAQTIGKYMEGGVLRQEDIVKYKKILPQITDTPQVAQNKIDNLKSLLAQKQTEYLNSYADAGYDVSKYGSSQASQITSYRGVYKPGSVDTSTPTLNGVTITTSIPE